MIQFLLYLLRWQASNLILAPVLSRVLKGCWSFGTVKEWKAASIANLVGGIGFFVIDRWIFGG